ncbi:MAG TPA: hypothetical protein VF554_11905 [Thermoanaerobaculia bacterium]|jgi:hypothetical protein
MGPKSLGVVFALLLAATPASRAQDLSPAEKKLAQSVEARLGEEMAALAASATRTSSAAS